MAYLLLFLAGVFGANGIPHFVKGITGEWRQTPFKNPSGPQLNVGWGAINLFLAAWLLYWAILYGEPTFGLGSVVFFLGFLTTGLLLARMWLHNPQAKGK